VQASIDCNVVPRRVSSTVTELGSSELGWLVSTKSPDAPCRRPAFTPMASSPRYRCVPKVHSSTKRQ